ncbi:MAG: LPS assembly lipoprotein LptE [Maricaulaceae bacterium]
MNGWMGAGLLVASLSLAACGFQPLYAERSGVTERLSQVGFVAPESDVGFALQQELVNRVGVQPTANNTPYRLEVQVREGRQIAGLRADRATTRVNLILGGAYALIDNATGEVVLDGEGRSFVSFDVPDEPYASVIVEFDARERAVAELADQIRGRLAIYFNKTPSSLAS